MIGIRNGRVLTSGGVIEADLLIEGDRVTRVGGSFDAPTTLDVSGAWIGPGLVDLHVHLREPGHEWKEDVASGSRAAAAGGFTAIVAMPNTDPAIDSGHRARFVADRGVQAGHCLVVPAGSITLGRRGEVLAHLDELWAAGVRLFTDDGDTVADAGLLRYAMEYLAERGGVLAQHAEDAGLSRDGQIHEGSVSSRLGMKGIPALAEEIIVARDLALARLTGVSYHVQHLSTAGSVSLLRTAKEQGMAVTAEVTPHHLTFDHLAAESMDPAFKMYPPLRTTDDVAFLRAALAEGIIDAVATDHAPHAAHETEVPFEEAPRGVIGLETAAAAVFHNVALDQMSFYDRMSVGPAAIARLERHGRLIEEGSPANLTAFDSGLSWTVGSYLSKSANSPWTGLSLTGRVIATVFEGTVTHRLEPANV
jgi:dihydroorotase